MRFLCLHGLGDNARIFEQQTAAIRYGLDSHHTYDFIEGTIPWESSNGDVTESTFTYCDPHSAESCVKASHFLDRYIQEEGPYDGMIGFSLGASMIVSWLMHKQESLQREGRSEVGLPVKVAILFSTRDVYDAQPIQQGRLVGQTPESNGTRLDIPSAHLWGGQDPSHQEAQNGSQFFNPDKCSIFVHGIGHDIPVSAEDTVSAVKVINRAIEIAAGADVR